MPSSVAARESSRLAVSRRAVCTGGDSAGITTPAPGEVGEHLKVVFHAVPQLLKCRPLQGQLLL